VGYNALTKQDHV